MKYEVFDIESNLKLEYIDTIIIWSMVFWVSKVWILFNPVATDSVVVSKIKGIDCFKIDFS